LKERKNYVGSQTPSIIEGKGVRRCLHHAAPHQELEERELMGTRGVACCAYAVISLFTFSFSQKVEVNVCCRFTAPLMKKKKEDHAESVTLTLSIEI